MVDIKKHLTARRYFEEGMEVGTQVIEDSGWYVLLFGQWCWDEESQEA